MPEYRFIRLDGMSKTEIAFDGIRTLDSLYYHFGRFLRGAGFSDHLVERATIAAQNALTSEYSRGHSE